MSSSIRGMRKSPPWHIAMPSGGGIHSIISRSTAASASFANGRQPMRPPTRAPGCVKDCSIRPIRRVASGPIPPIGRRRMRRSWRSTASPAAFTARSPRGALCPGRSGGPTTPNRKSARVRGQSPILHRYNLHPSKNLAISRNSDPKGIIWAADQARPRAREIYREEEVMAICAAALDHSGSTDYRPQ